MAIYEIKRAPGDAISTRIATAAVRAAYRVIDARRAYATRQILDRLSDEMLDDIGLRRGDIPAAARGRI